MTDKILVLSRTIVRRLLPLRDCIAAVEAAFRDQAAGYALPSGVLGTHVTGGGFHVKTCGLTARRPYYVAKVNSNFPDNTRLAGRPTIQGVLALFDATNGAPLALMDSAEITRLRTAAATGVAASHLAAQNAESITVCGCGLQGRVQLETIGSIRPLRRVFAFDTDPARARTFADELGPALGLDVTPVATIADGSRQSDIVVTCTTSSTPILGLEDVKAGTFIAAVGADSESKQEIDVALMATSAVVVDVLSQCVTIGDLHHAIAAGVMNESDVVGDLSDLVSGRITVPLAGRTIVFDSTGTALEDVAAAALVYERALALGDSPTIALND